MGELEITPGKESKCRLQVKLLSKLLKHSLFVFLDSSCSAFDLGMMSIKEDNVDSHPVSVSYITATLQKAFDISEFHFS